jgi:hypothetical protein
VANAHLEGRDWPAVLDRLLETMVAQQEAKVLTLARELVPGITPEDLRNPQDFAALMRDPSFNFEDGLLAGLRSAQMAVRAEVRCAVDLPAPPGKG